MSLPPHIARQKLNEDQVLRDTASTKTATISVGDQKLPVSVDTSVKPPTLPIVGKQSSSVSGAADAGKGLAEPTLKGRKLERLLPDSRSGLRAFGKAVLGLLPGAAAIVVGTLLGGPVGTLIGGAIAVAITPVSVLGADKGLDAANASGDKALQQDRQHAYDALSSLDRKGKLTDAVLDHWSALRSKDKRALLQVDGSRVDNPADQRRVREAAILAFADARSQGVSRDDAILQAKKASEQCQRLVESGIDLDLKDERFRLKPEDLVLDRGMAKEERGGLRRGADDAPFGATGLLSGNGKRNPLLSIDESGSPGSAPVDPTKPDILHDLKIDDEMEPPPFEHSLPAAEPPKHLHASQRQSQQEKPLGRPLHSGDFERLKMLRSDKKPYAADPALSNPPKLGPLSEQDFFKLKRLVPQGAQRQNRAAVTGQFKQKVKDERPVDPKRVQPRGVDTFDFQDVFKPSPSEPGRAKAFGDPSRAFELLAQSQTVAEDNDLMTMDNDLKAADEAAHTALRALGVEESGVHKGKPYNAPAPGLDEDDVLRFRELAMIGAVVTGHDQWDEDLLTQKLTAKDRADLRTRLADLERWANHLEARDNRWEHVRNDFSSDFALLSQSDNLRIMRWVQPELAAVDNEIAQLKGIDDPSAPTEPVPKRRDDDAEQINKINRDRLVKRFPTKQVRGERMAHLTRYRDALKQQHDEARAAFKDEARYMTKRYQGFNADPKTWQNEAKGHPNLPAMTPQARAALLHAKEMISHCQQQLDVLELDG